MVMMYVKELCVLHNNNHNNCHTHKIEAKRSGSGVVTPLDQRSTEYELEEKMIPF